MKFRLKASKTRESVGTVEVLGKEASQEPTLEDLQRAVLRRCFGEDTALKHHFEEGSENVLVFSLNNEVSKGP